jgi:hypothetical protein
MQSFRFSPFCEVVGTNHPFSFHLFQKNRSVEAAVSLNRSAFSGGAVSFWSLCALALGFVAWTTPFGRPRCVS